MVTKEKFALWIDSRELHQMVKGNAALEGKTMSEFISHVMKEYFESKKELIWMSGKVEVNARVAGLLQTFYEGSHDLPKGKLGYFTR